MSFFYTLRIFIFGVLPLGAGLGFWSCAPVSASEKDRLSLAVKKNNIAYVEHYFSQGAKASLLLDFGRTPLHVASEWGQPAMVRLLVGRGVPVNAVDEAGYTALMLASQQGKLEIVKTLVASGAKLDLQDKGGFTALMAAAFNGKEIEAAYLLEMGADQTLKNLEGKTALDLARAWGHRGIIRLLETTEKK